MVHKELDFVGQSTWLVLCIDSFPCFFWNAIHLRDDEFDAM